MTTTGLEPYFAGMVETFGPDVPVDVNFTLVEAKNFDIIRSKQKIIADIDFFMTVIIAAPG